MFHFPILYDSIPPFFQLCKENMEGKSFYAKGGKIFCKNHAVRQWDNSKVVIAVVLDSGIYLKSIRLGIKQTSI